MQEEHIVLYTTKEECCGCSACYAVCPKDAITMQEDEEGFLYPEINYELCITCKSCLKVCPIKKADAGMGGADIFLDH